MKSAKPTEGQEVLKFSRESEAEAAWNKPAPSGTRFVKNELCYEKDGTYTVIRQWKPQTFAK